VELLILKSKKSSASCTNINAVRRSRFRWKWCISHKNGFESFSTEIPQRRTEYEEKLKSSGTGTVGCVAFDQNGKIAATSTGGKGFEVPGRISDSAAQCG
jgi:isoaspartyl peptidase/L-asparaginase-like protein (Ntn-hydrolase superfamily)